MRGFAPYAVIMRRTVPIPDTVLGLMRTSELPDQCQISVVRIECPVRQEQDTRTLSKGTEGQGAASVTSRSVYA